MASKRLFDRLSQKGIIPGHAAEVGVYHPRTSNILEYIKNNTRCTLVEPDPESVSQIKREFKDNDNIELIEKAVFDRSGEIELIRREASTFVGELEKSPAIVNDSYVPSDDDRFTVPACTFDEIDDGTIDLLSVDIEGSEWYVIKNLVSRPAVISIETHGALYSNPHLNEIRNWMKQNGYRVWYKTNTDTVFAREDKVEVSSSDRIELVFSNLKHFLIRLKKSAKRVVKQ